MTHMGAKPIEQLDEDPAWRTRDGALVAISGMTDGHLVNTLKMIKRAHDRKVLASCAIAEDNDFMEQAVNAYDLAGPELTCYQAYPRLLEEALRRGLKVSL